MANDFIPSRDADFEAWFLNFKTLIAATPTSYGLVSADATVISNSYVAWHSAYVAATTPTTRNHLTIAAKDAQKILSTDVVRTYSTTIRANTAVSDTLKLGLGLNPHDTIPTTIPPPPPTRSCA